MSGRLLAEVRFKVPEGDRKAFVRTHLGAGLRRAGPSAECLVASAVACWNLAGPVAPPVRLGLFWTNTTGLGPEVAGLLETCLARGEEPMPFQFIASQPHMAACHAAPFLPGLVQAGALVGPPTDLEAAFLDALAAQEAWTHLLVGTVATPGPYQEAGAPFTAHWRLLAFTEPPLTID
jgi:hypothetical protein